MMINVLSVDDGLVGYLSILNDYDLCIWLFYELYLAPSGLWDRCEAPH